ncbi:hypothetical protein Tco_0473603 [Tanacetum coccineum]
MSSSIAGSTSGIPLYFRAVSDNVWKATELGAEAKGSLVLELEDLTLETQDAKPVISECNSSPPNLVAAEW